MEADGMTYLMYTRECDFAVHKTTKKERSLVDIARGELVEKELDQMIERRSRQKDPDEESELWRESVRAYEEKRRLMTRLEWHAFHCGQAERHRATLQALIEHHESEAARLMEATHERSLG
jgi:molecular chaperone DnaK (HSP70)